LQAAIDGAGVVLGWIVLAEADLAAGSLVRPFKTVLPLDVSSFLVRSKVAAPRQELRSFRDWLFGSLQSSSDTRKLPTKIDGSIGNACFQRARSGAPSTLPKC
jgi:LysR family glycine cleavage system transcriptional activator